MLIGPIRNNFEGKKVNKLFFFYDIAYYITLDWRGGMRNFSNQLSGNRSTKVPNFR